MKSAKGLIAGVIGGIAGALVMSGIMTLGQRSGMIGTTPPEEMTQSLEERTGTVEETGRRQDKALTWILHLAVGVVFGTLYAPLLGALRFPASLKGPLYGLGVYAVNLVGLGPALRLTPEPWRQQPLTVARRMWMHAVFGTVVALVFNRARRLLD